MNMPRDAAGVTQLLDGRVLATCGSITSSTEVYDPATDPARKTPRVAATLSFYRGKAKISESEPIVVTESPAKRPHIAPFQFQAPLAKLSPGRYTCQVNVVDELGRRFTFARSPVVVTP